MSLNETPQGERVHIGIFGRTNTGKSSLINAMTNQEISIVSSVKGTTTDPVQKAMELLPLGPVMLIDTAGLDDESELGQKRVARARDIMRKTDIVVLVGEGNRPPDAYEKELLKTAAEAGLPVVVALNKSDEGTEALATWGELAAEDGRVHVVSVSAKTRAGVDELKELLASLKPNRTERILIRDLVPANEVCVLVVPIDKAAPKGRLILPQQQVIRDLLEGGSFALVVRDTEYAAALKRLGTPPALVVTDSQAFAFVAERTPRTVPLTSFSILFARYKGDLTALVDGAKAIDALDDGDRVLICEGCTHHRQCDDIGTVKIPKWLAARTGKKLELAFTSGTGFPEDLSPYKLVIHCGGCMLNEREMEYRIVRAGRTGVPIVNYGVFIAHVNGILARCIEPLLT